MQEDVTGAEHVRRLLLRIRAGEGDPFVEPEAGDLGVDLPSRRLLGRPSQRTRDDEPHIAAARNEPGDGLERDVDAVAQVLAAADEERQRSRGRRSRREPIGVDGVVEDLGRSVAPAEERFGRNAAELALEEDVVCLVQDGGHRPVDPCRRRAHQTRVRDTVLVPRDRRAAAPREPDEHAPIPWHAARSKVQEVETGHVVRPDLLEPLELHHAAVHRLAEVRDARVAVEERDAAAPPTPGGYKEPTRHRGQDGTRLRDAHDGCLPAATLSRTAT